MSNVSVVWWRHFARFRSVMPAEEAEEMGMDGECAVESITPTDEPELAIEVYPRDN